MGLLNKIKKKQILQKIKNTNNLGEIAKNLAENHVISVPKDDNHNTFGDRLDKLDENGELPWGWISHHKDFIEPRDSNVSNLHIKAKTAKTIQEEKQCIEEFLDAFYKYKNECAELGECYVKYFNDMFEKCHNSKNPCFSIGDKMKERYEYIIKNDNVE